MTTKMTTIGYKEIARHVSDTSFFARAIAPALLKGRTPWTGKWARRAGQFLDKILRPRKFLAILVLLIANGSAYAAGPTLRMVGDNWCPYNCPPDAKQRGYMVDLLERILGKDYTVSYQLEPWTRALALVETGEMDLLIATPISGTPKLLHSVPLGIDRTCFFVRQENTWQFRKLSDLANVRLGIIQDYNYDDEGPLDKLIASYRKRNDNRLEVAFGNDALTTNFRKLQGDRMDVLVENENVGNYTIKQLDLSKTIRLAGCANHRISETRIAISPTRKDGKALLELLSSGIEKMRKSGELATLLAQYGMQDWKPFLKK